MLVRMIYDFRVFSLWGHVGNFKKQNVMQNEHIFGIHLLYFGSCFSLEQGCDGHKSASLSWKADFLLTFNDITAEISFTNLAGVFYHS